jgi:hypothetical protein
MKKLSVLLLVALMLFSVAGVAAAAVNINGYAIFTLDTAVKDEVTQAERGGVDQIDYNLFFNSAVNRRVDWTARLAVISDSIGWNVGLREAYFDVKTGRGVLRVGNWEITTWETVLFDEDNTSFNRIKGWLGLGYTSPDLLLKNLKFKAAYFADGQKAGDSITDNSLNYNGVPFGENAYVATIEYQNDWLTANCNLINTKIKNAVWDKSYGSTLNIIAKTPLEGLEAVLYTGRDTGNYEMVIAGLWYKYRDFGFRYEMDLIDDIPNEKGNNRSAFEFSYTLPHGIEFQYRYRDLATKYNEIRGILRF